MTIPDENQHWVPKFLIKNFADADGRVFCLNIQTDRVTKPPPRFAASGAGFNNFVMDGTAVSYEDRLEKIETAAAPILNQIVSSRTVAGLTDAQRQKVADFLATQSFRTEAFYKGFEEQKARLDFGPIFATLWRSAFLMAAEILRRQWAVMVIEHDDVFYLGDNPVVLQHTETPAAKAELGFDVKGVEAYLPLAPNCALYMPCASTCHDITSGYETAARNIHLPELRTAAPSSDLDSLLQLSRRVLKKSGALYRALTTGVALIATAENVENLNYLQASWAHAAIHSNRRDFAFARRVFRENPQYRSTVKVRLTAFGGT